MLRGIGSVFAVALFLVGAGMIYAAVSGRGSTQAEAIVVGATLLSIGLFTGGMILHGYNGRLHGWGWEDQDMIARLTLAAGLKRIQRCIVTHLSHGDAERIANYPPVRDRWESRDRMFRQALSNYDAGDFVGTYWQDNEQLSVRMEAPAAFLATR